VSAKNTPALFDTARDFGGKAIPVYEL